MILYFVNKFKYEFLFLIFFSFSTHAQSAVDKVSIVNNNQTTANQELSSKIEFAIWFMGTNQTPNSLFQPETKNPKKQIMSSGVVPNRLLLESFLKKAVGFETNWG
jgi:hypothetical protein